MVHDLQHVADDDGVCGYCDKESDASKHCKTFRIEIEPVSRAEIPALFDDDAITGVKRAGETFFQWCAGGFAAYFLLLVLHGWRTRRYLARRSAAA